MRDSTIILIHSGEIKKQRDLESLNLFRKASHLKNSFKSLNLF